MERRSFLSSLFALPAAAVMAPPAPMPKPKPLAPVVVDHFPVAGFQYHDGPRVERTLRVGQVLRLAREPQNPYDELAIAIYAGSAKLGYVPRDSNAMPAGCLDGGVPLTAVIEGLAPEAESWGRVVVGLGVIRA
jgi:hypothetical protein